MLWRMATSDSNHTTGQRRTAARQRPEYLPSSEFITAFGEIARPFIVAHVTPDGDAIGGILGLTASLREQGIEATAGLPTASIAMKLRFMLEMAPEIVCVDHWDPGQPYDSLIVLDTASEKRINIQPAPDLSGGRPVFNIDHHVTNTRFGQHIWVDGHATSTCELVARLLDVLKWMPSERTASLLYAGIHVDTSGFSLPTTSAEALQTASGLVRVGADVGFVGEQLCRSQARSEFDLLRRVYDNTHVIEDGRIAYSHLSYKEITEAGCKADDIDDQVSVPRSLKGVQIALLFTEGEPGVIRVNLRGEGDVSVVEVAQKLGGGGHRQAAGLRFQDKTMDEIISVVCNEAAEHLRSHRGRQG
jgi:phosphoesterase RecJ-like protein